MPEEQNDGGQEGRVPITGEVASIRVKVSVPNSPELLEGLYRDEVFWRRIESRIDDSAKEILGPEYEAHITYIGRGSLIVDIVVVIGTILSISSLDYAHIIQNLSSFRNNVGGIFRRRAQDRMDAQQIEVNTTLSPSPSLTSANVALSYQRPFSNFQQSGGQLITSQFSRPNPPWVGFWVTTILQTALLAVVLGLVLAITITLMR